MKIDSTLFLVFLVMVWVAACWLIIDMLRKFWRWRLHIIAVAVVVFMFPAYSFYALRTAALMIRSSVAWTYREYLGKLKRKYGMA